MFFPSHIREKTIILPTLNHVGIIMSFSFSQYGRQFNPFVYFHTNIHLAKCLFSPEIRSFFSEIDFFFPTCSFSYIHPFLHTAADRLCWSIGPSVGVGWLSSVSITSRFSTFRKQGDVKRSQKGTKMRKKERKIYL